MQLGYFFWPNVLLNRRRAVGVECLDRLEAPRLTFLALGLGPDDGLPVGGEHQSSACIVDLDPVAAGLVDVQKEGLLHGVLVWAGLDAHAVLEADVGGAQHLFLGIDGPRRVMETAVRAVVIGGERDVVGLVVGSHPRTGDRAAVEHDHLGRPHAEHVFHEPLQAGHVGGEQVEVIEPPHVGAARGKPHRLVLQRRLQLWRRLVPLGLVVDLHLMAVRRREGIRGTMPEVAVGPSLPVAGLLDDANAMLQGGGARGPEREMPHAGGLRGGQLERVVLVVVPPAQVDGVAAPATLGHAHDIDEETEALLGQWRQQLEVGEMGQVERTDRGFQESPRASGLLVLGARRAQDIAHRMVTLVARVLVDLLRLIDLCQRHHVGPRTRPDIRVFERHAPLDDGR